MTDYAAKIAALEAAIGSGELRVESDGESVTYRSMDDLLKARDLMISLQAQSSPASVRPATTLAIFDPS